MSRDSTEPGLVPTLPIANNAGWARLVLRGLIVLVVGIVFVTEAEANQEHSRKRIAHTLKGHTDSITAMAVHGPWLVTASKDKTIRVWDMENGASRLVLRGHTDDITALAVSRDWIVSGDADDIVRVWQLSDGRLLQTLKGHGDTITSLVISGQRIISADTDGKVLFWQQGREMPERVWESGLSNPVISLQEDNLVLLGEGGFGSRSVKVFNWKIGSVVNEFDAPSSKNQAVIRDNLVAVTRLTNAGSVERLDGEIIEPSVTEFFDVMTGKIQYELYHNFGVYEVLGVFGDYLFAVSINFDLEVWDIPSQRLLDTVYRIYADGEGVAVATGPYIISGDKDGVVTMFRGSDMFIDKNANQNRKPVQTAGADDLTPRLQKLSASTPNPHKWLFAIGVEQYDDTDPVIYSRASTEAFVSLMQKRYGVPRDQTFELVETRATAGRIKDQLATLVSKVKSGDTVYFYYSGHGVPDPHTGEAYILPQDRLPQFVARDDSLRLDYIYDLLNRSAAGKIIVVVDACFSGRTDNRSVFKGVAPGLIRVKARGGIDPSRMAVLTAGQDNQFSNSFDSKRHRLFSYFLMNALMQGARTAGEVVRTISKPVYEASRAKGDAYEQLPQLSGHSGLAF